MSVWIGQAGWRRCGITIENQPCRRNVVRTQFGWVTALFDVAKQFNMRRWRRHREPGDLNGYMCKTIKIVLLRASVAGLGGHAQPKRFVK